VDAKCSTVQSNRRTVPSPIAISLIVHLSRTRNSPLSTVLKVVMSTSLLSSGKRAGSKHRFIRSILRVMRPRIGEERRTCMFLKPHAITNRLCYHMAVWPPGYFICLGSAAGLSSMLVDLLLGLLFAVCALLILFMHWSECMPTLKERMPCNQSQLSRIAMSSSVD
jgi:hypothetical protein